MGYDFQQAIKDATRQKQESAQQNSQQRAEDDAAAARQQAIAQRDALMQDKDIFSDFLKKSESKYGFNMKQFDPVTGGRYRNSKKPTPTTAQRYAMYDQYVYNIEREQIHGKNKLDFGTPDYNPYDRDDDDNEVWGSFISKYNRLPLQQEFERDKSTFLTEKQEKANKYTANLLDVPYKAGDELKPNPYWQQLGYTYDEADVLDLKRKDAGLPPKAYLDKYNRNLPEDVWRLQNGEIPSYYDNTTKALAEKKVFEDAVMELAASNKIQDENDIYALFSEQGKYGMLKSIDGYIKEYNKTVEAEGELTEYDKLVGKGKKMPRQHLDLDELGKAGYTISKDDIGGLTSTWLSDLAQKAIADEDEKYGGSSWANTKRDGGFFKNVLGWFEETDYERQRREAAAAPTATVMAPPAYSADTEYTNPMKTKSLVTDLFGATKNVGYINSTNDIKATLDDVLQGDPGSFGNSIRLGWIRGQLNFMRGNEAEKARLGADNNLQGINELMDHPALRSQNQKSLIDTLKTGDIGQLVGSSLEQLARYPEAINKAFPIYDAVRGIFGDKEAQARVQKAQNDALIYGGIGVAGLKNITDMFGAIFYEQAGAAYADLIEKGIDHSTAATASDLVGFVNGGIEFAEIGTLWGKVPGLSKLSKAITAPIKSAVLAAVVKGVARYTGVVTAETFQEILQETMSIVGEEASKAIDREAGKSDIPAASTEEIKERYLQTIDQTVKAMLLTGIGGAMNSRTDTNTQTQQQAGPQESAQEAAGAPVVETVTTPPAEAALTAQQEAVEAGTAETIAAREPSATAEDIAAVAPAKWEPAIDPATEETYSLTSNKRFAIREQGGQFALYEGVAQGDRTVATARGSYSTLAAAQKAAQDVVKGQYKPGVQTQAAAAGYGTDPSNLVNDLTEIKNDAAELATEGGRSIASAAQKLIDEFVNISFDQADETASPDTTAMRNEAQAKGMGKDSMKVLDRVIQAYENDMPQLIAKLRQELDAAKTKARTELAALRSNKNAKLDAMEQKRQADVLAMRDKKNAEMGRKLDKLEAKRRDDLAKLREAKNAAAERGKTKAVFNDLKSQYSDKAERPLQPELRAALPEFIAALDGLKMGGKIDATKLTQFLQKAMNGLTDNKLIDAQWGEDVAPALAILSELNGRTVDSLTAADMKDLRKAIRSIIHLNQSAYQVLVDGQRVDANAVASQMLQVNRDRKDVSPQKQTDRTATGKSRMSSRIGDYFGLASLEPMNVVNIIMGTTREGTIVHKVMSKAMEKAGWNHAKHRLADHQALISLVKALDKKKWFQSRAEYVLPSGNKVSLSLDELCAIYMNSKNADNRASLANQIRLETPGKTDASLTFTLTEADADALIETAEKNAEVKRVGDGLFKWNNDLVSPRINEASQERFGFDMADVEGYWPIRRDSQEMIKSFAIMGRTLETFSWQKKRVGSTKPIVLDGAVSTAVRMSEESALFGAYAVPVKNMQRVIRLPDVQKMLRQKFGDSMVRYWDSFFREAVLKQGGKVDRVGGYTLWLARNRQAAILATPKVILNQFAGIAAAVAFLDTKHLPKALLTRANLKLMEQHAPMMYERRVFGGSPEAGALINMGILPETGVDRIRSKMTMGVQKGDTITMDLAWNWSELQVRADNPNLTGDAFYKKVGELAQEVVGRTQPTNEVAYRSLIENTKGVNEKLLLPFSSGINKVYNMMADAKLAYDCGDIKRANRRVAGVVANGLAFALVQSLWAKFWRGNDDEPFWKQFTEAFFENFVTAPYLGSITYSGVRAIFGNYQFSVRNIPLDAVGDVVNGLTAISGAGDALNDSIMLPEKTKDEREKKAAEVTKAWARLAGGGKKFAQAAAGLFVGIPATEFERDGILPVLRIFDLNAYYKYLGTFKADSGASADFKKAAAAGNKKKAEDILAVLVEEKGTASVKRSWEASDWYKKLTQAEKTVWDKVLAKHGK